MQEVAVQWYAILGTLNAAVTDPLRGLSDSLGLPLVSALLFGRYLLRLVPRRFSVGFGLAEWIEARAGPGAGGAFLLGTAFSFAFCPTLFLLFFGLTIPLALQSSLGVVYPGVFALGTTLPLIGLAA